MAELRVRNTDLQTGRLLIAGRKYRLASGRPAGVVENIDSVAGGAADRAHLSPLANEVTLGYFVGVPPIRARVQAKFRTNLRTTESAAHTREGAGIPSL